MEKKKFNGEKRPWLQAATCGWTRVVSGVPQQEFKVQIARGRVAAWFLDPSGERSSTRWVPHPINLFGHRSY